MKKHKNLEKSKDRILFVASVIVFIVVVALGTSCLYIFLKHKNDVSTVGRKDTTISDSSDDSQTIDRSNVTPQIPIHITIDKIGVDADINPLGQEEDGKLSAPKNLKDVGWYDKSAKLGEKSPEHSILLDGHFGLKWDQGVFYNLGKLHIGDKIILSGKNNDKIEFAVENKKIKNTEDIDMEKIYNYGDGEQSLAIITCDGRWNNDTHKYNKRLVVFAKIIS